MTISSSRSQDRALASQTPSTVLEKIDYGMLFLLFLSCSTPYRIWAGSISVATAEIGVWVFFLWRWLTGWQRDESIERNSRWLKRGLIAITIVGGILWSFSENWTGRREMFVNWLLAALMFSCLLGSPRKDAKRLALLFVLAALPNALLGLAQHASGIGLAPKDFSGWSEGAMNFPVYGFFGHSNDLAVFLYWPLLISAALSFTRRGWSKLPFALMTVLFGLVLYWTVSRATLLTVVAVLVILALMYFLSRRKAFLAVMAAGLAAVVLVLVGIFLTQSAARIDTITSGRLSLWNDTLQVISGDPLFLPFGYLSFPPANLSVFYIPHNIYLLSWIQYGWIGIILLIGMACFFIIGGLKRYPDVRKLPLAAGLWAGLAGLFLVNGMASLYFHETYVILNFICVAAIWVFQIREIDLAAPVPQTDLPAPQKQTPARKPVKSAAKKKK